MSTIPLSLTLPMSPKVCYLLIGQDFLHVISHLNLTDVIMDTDDGVITAENSMVCHLLTIVDNDIAEPDGEVVITINQSSLYPPTTLISRSTTTINILNDDGKLQLILILIINIMYIQ